MNKEKILDILRVCGWVPKKEIDEHAQINLELCSFDNETGLQTCGAKGRHEYINREKVIEKLNNKTLESFCPVLYSHLKEVNAELGKETKEIEKTPQELVIEYESPIKSGDYTVGFVDCKTTIKGKHLSREHISIDFSGIDAYLEVKTTIPSFGELMRQMNLYRTNIRKPALWVVVSPDDRFADAIRSQEIYFYKWG